MARNTYEDWIPEEWDSRVIERVRQVSATESLGRHYPMGTDTRHVPRSAGVEVNTTAKGVTYEEDASVNDEILLTARKFTRAIRIAEEDLADSNVGILEQKRVDWATSYAKCFDNATLAVTAETANGTTVPYVSVYGALRQDNADTGYTADANYISANGVSYDTLSAVLARYEEGDYFDLGLTSVIAHPHFREVLRNVKDDSNNPVFVRGQTVDRGTPDTLFNIPITWSLGAKTSPTAVQSPSGNPLLIVCNHDFLAVGDRSGPESMVAAANSGPAFLSDEALLKMRARKGFAVGHEKAFAVLEDTA